MKLYSNQLSQLIEQISSHNIKSLLLYGHNRGFISEILNQLSKNLQFFTITLHYNQVTEADLHILGNTNNFLKQREMLKIYYSGSLITRKLSGFLIKGHFTNFICFIGDESLPFSGIRKVFEESPNMASLGCYYNDKNIIAKLINLITAEKRISEEALFYLKQVLNVDYQIAKNELLKILNYTYDKNIITYQDVKASISLDLSINVDKACIFFTRRELRLFLDEIEKLHNQDINQLFIIRSLIKYYINLFIICSKKESGEENIESAIKSLFPPLYKYINDFRENVKILSSDKVIKVISVLQNAEVKIKRGNSKFNFLEEIYLLVNGYI